MNEDSHHSAKRPRTMSPTPSQHTAGSAMLSSEIVNIVQDIITTTSMLRSVQDSKDIHMSKYPEFAKAFPVLFASACEPNFDFVRFRYMINMRDKITNNTTTLEDASKEVGQTLFDKYVQPIVNTL